MAPYDGKYIDGEGRHIGWKAAASQEVSGHNEDPTFGAPATDDALPRTQGIHFFVLNEEE